MAFDQPAPDGRVAVDRNRKVEVALLALATSPVPPLLPMKEMKADGRHPAIAFAIASANFPDQRFGAIIL
jgi:hypothetical protein